MKTRILLTAIGLLLGTLASAPAMAAASNQAACERIADMKKMTLMMRDDFLAKCANYKSSDLTKIERCWTQQLEKLPEQQKGKKPTTPEGRIDAAMDSRLNEMQMSLQCRQWEIQADVTATDLPGQARSDTNAIFHETDCKTIADNRGLTGKARADFSRECKSYSDDDASKLAQCEPLVASLETMHKAVPGMKPDPQFLIEKKMCDAARQSAVASARK